jgi:hypothetical protein
VIHVVLAALGRATAACLGAQRTDGVHVFAASGHRGSGELADVGTLEIQGDATRHRFRIGYLQAGSCTLQACHGAFVACAQAGFFCWLIMSVLHNAGSSGF